MAKLDIKKQYKQHYVSSTKKITQLNVGVVKFLMIDGNGNPEVDEFKFKVAALRSFIKEFKAFFKDNKIIYVSPPVEGVWDTYDNQHFDVTRKQMINFSLMIPLVGSITDDIVQRCKDILLLKNENPYIIDVYVKHYEEGRCIQMLHKGPYNTEIDTTTKIMEFITIENLKLKGMHHEVYLNNPDKVKPKDLKTIIRYAIEDA